MTNSVFQIPYIHGEKKCLLEIKYSINTDPITSGFEIVKNLVPDLNICIGYPTLHAYIKEHEGYGFCRYCGFVQTVLIENSLQAVKIVDVPPIMQEMGIPFCSYGFPAELFDAPVNSYGLGREIVWSANTYLVDMPSYVNGNNITFLAGFKWGYTEYSDHIDITPIEIISSSSWEQEKVFIKQNFDRWNFN